MRISKDENPDFYEKLFGDIGKYEQWAPFFYPEFVTKYSRMKGVVAGVMTPSLVNINDNLINEFEIWLSSKDIFLQNVYPTRAAEYINKLVLVGYEEYQPYSDVPAKKRVKPTEEQAREYVKCVKTLQCFYEGIRVEGIEKISMDEYPAFSKKEESSKKTVKWDYAGLLVSSWCLRSLMRFQSVTIVSVTLKIHAGRFL